MLIAIFTFLFLGGEVYGPLVFLDAAESNATSAITDKALRGKVEEIFDGVREETNAYRKDRQKQANALEQLLADRAINESAVRAVWREYGRTTDSYYQRVLDARFALRKSLSREQWAMLFGDSSP